VRSCVARLRAVAGTDPDAPDLTRLAGELILKSPEFARLWEGYDVKSRPTGRKTFQHPGVGELTLGYQSMALEGTPGHRLVAYYAEPGTADHDVMVLLDLLGQGDETAEAPASDTAVAHASDQPQLRQRNEPGSTSPPPHHEGTGRAFPAARESSSAFADH
jgi:hypothetical protein